MNTKKRNPQQLARDFMTANDISPVISGYTHGEGGQGGVYTLENGKSYDLPRNACTLLTAGYPRWKLD